MSINHTLKETESKKELEKKIKEFAIPDDSISCFHRAGDPLRTLHVDSEIGKSIAYDSLR